MRIYLIFLLVFLSFVRVYAQHPFVDSVMSLLSKASDAETRFLLYYELASFYQEDQKDSCLYYAALMEQENAQLNQPIKSREIFIQKGLAHGFAYEFEEERAYYQKALAVSKAGKDEKGQGISLINIGVSFMLSKDIDSAIIYFEPSVVILERIGDVKNLSYVYNNLGLLYRKMKKYDAAKDTYLRSISIKEQLNDFKGIINTSLNLASLYINVPKYDSAWLYVSQARHLAEVNDLKNQYASAMITMGLIKRKTGQSDSAFFYFDQSMILLNYVKDIELETELYFNLASLYAENQ